MKPINRILTLCCAAAPVILFPPGAKAAPPPVAALAGRWYEVSQSALADTYYKRALSCCEQGQFDRAYVDLTEVIRERPDSAEAYFERGRVCVALKRYGDAIVDYSSALHVNHTFTRALIERAKAYSARHEYDRSIADYKKYITLNPGLAPEDLGRVYHSLASAYSSNKEYAHAITYYTEALSKLPNDNAVLYGRATAEYNSDALDRAAADLTAGVATGSASSDFYLLLAKLYWRQYNYRDAIATYSRLIGLPGKSPRSMGYAYTGRGLVYLDVARKAKTASSAVEILNRAIDDFDRASTIIEGTAGLKKIAMDLKASIAKKAAGG